MLVTTTTSTAPDGTITTTTTTTTANDGATGADAGARPAAAGPDLAKFWLVGSDIDGTFVAENPAGRTLPDVPPEANKQLYQHLCYYTTASVMDLIEVDGFVLCFHGAAIFGPRAGAVERPLIKSWPLPVEAVRGAATISAETGDMAMYYTAHGIITAGTCHNNFNFPSPHSNSTEETALCWWARVGEFPVPIPGHPVFESLSDEHKALVLSSPLTPHSKFFDTHEELLAYLEKNSVDVFKVVLLTAPGDPCKAAMAATRERFPSELVHIIGPFGFYYEMLNPKCNKAVALGWLAEDCGGTLDNAVAFGDSHNDYEMLRDSGHGVVMSNGVDANKEVATVVSQWSNSQASVAKELCKLLDDGRIVSTEARAVVPRCAGD